MNRFVKAAALAATLALSIGSLPALAQDEPAVPEAPASDLA